MAKKESQEVAVIDPQMMAELDSLYPKETSNFSRISLPRIGFASQDVIEGVGKAKKVTVEAGTFFIEKQTDETNAEGKKIWSKTEIGQTFDGIILYHRYQLSYYDEEKEEYSSTPVFDSQEEVLPLFCNKKQIAKGTAIELKKLYKFVDKDGKEKSKLKDNRIVYVLYENELFQLNLHGSSMYSFLKYIKTVNPPTIITKFASEFQEKGKIQWNMMTFHPRYSITPEQFPEILAKVKEIKLAVQLEKGTQVEVVDRYVKENEDAEEEFNKKW